jgi:hypothetical protein
MLISEKMVPGISIENTPTPRDILRELRSKTDAALEDFVKAQAAVQSTIDIIEDIKNKIDINETNYRNLVRGRQYSFLKAYEAEIDELHKEINRLKTFLEYHKNDLSDLDSISCEKAMILENARKAEREYFDAHF